MHFEASEPMIGIESTTPSPRFSSFTRRIINFVRCVDIFFVIFAMVGMYDLVETSILSRCLEVGLTLLVFYAMAAVLACLSNLTCMAEIGRLDICIIFLSATYVFGSIAVAFFVSNSWTCFQSDNSTYLHNSYVLYFGSKNTLFALHVAIMCVSEIRIFFSFLCSIIRLDWAHQLRVSPSKRFPALTQAETAQIPITLWKDTDAPFDRTKDNPKEEALHKLKEGISNMSCTCKICLEEFADEAKVRRTNCQHVFHSDCLATWLARQNTCPTCRQQAWKVKIS